MYEQPNESTQQDNGTAHHETEDTNEKDENEHHVKDEHGSDENEHEVERYKVASVNFDRVQTPYIISAWVILACLAKLREYFPL